MTVLREPIYEALFAKAASVTWGSAQTFQFTSRRIKLWADIPAFPALCQAEHREQQTQATNLAYKRKFTASWFLYHQSGRDPAAIPASDNNAILDGIEAALEPGPADPGYLDGRQTLGGLVHHCWIDGAILKDPGDLEGDALLIVPISLLIP